MRGDGVTVWALEGTLSCRNPHFPGCVISVVVFEEGASKAAASGAAFVVQVPSACAHLPNYYPISLMQNAVGCSFHALVEQPVCPMHYPVS